MLRSKRGLPVAGTTLLRLGIVVLTAVVLAQAGGAAPAVRVTLDGAELVFDIPGQIINNRTMVPFRGIFEALGATVDWDETTQTVTAVRGQDSVELTIASTVVKWRRSIIRADVAPVVVDGRTLIPLRFIGQALGTYVGWDGNTRTVILKRRPEDPVLARGIEVVHLNSCMVCHTIHGVGGNTGPVLNGVAQRYSEDWLRTWLRNPQAVREGSRMPNFGFSDPDIEAVIAFLRTLD